MQQWGSPASNTRTHHHQLETSPRPTHHRLPRPNQPLPLAPIHRQIDRLRAPARFRPDTSRTRCTHCISPARRVRLTDEADRATASCSQYALHPMWGAAPVTGRYTRCGALHPLRGAAPFTSRYTRCGALHPIRRGAMPTDRVQRHFQQALSRPRDHTNHQPTSTPPPPTNAAPFTSRYTRSEEVQCLRIGCSATFNKHFRDHASTPIISRRAHHHLPQTLHPLRRATPDVGRYTRSEEVQCLRIGCSAQRNKHFRGHALPT